jgi:hypothetical protein
VTRLSTATLLAAAARIWPRGITAVAAASSRASVRVLPVPGGPWMRRTAQVIGSQAAYPGIGYMMYILRYRIEGTPHPGLIGWVSQE